jgi:hypothetical protein
MDRKFDYSIIFNQIKNEKSINLHVESNLTETIEEVRKLKRIIDEIGEEQQPLSYTKT